MKAFVSLLLLLLSVTAAAEPLVVEFAADNDQPVVRGNLLVVLSEQKFAPHHPGLMRVYGGKLLAQPEQKLRRGDRVTLEIDSKLVQKRPFVGVYLDTNSNFMADALPDPSDYYGGRLARLAPGQTTRVRLDSVRPPRRWIPLPWLFEQAIVSERLLAAGFSREQATVRFLVGLPPGYWSSRQRYPVAYVSHGFSGNRWAYLKRYRAWREQMKQEPMLLVSLDSNGDYGHHLWLDSPANGPRTQVLVEELIPYIEGRFRSNGRRVIYGQSSGGWTAVSLLRRAPGVFSGAAATGPDPLKLSEWWMDESQNLYTNADGSERSFAPSINLSMRRFVGCETSSRSVGQYGAFLACFSPLKQGGVFPFESPFELDSGRLRPDIWKKWQDNDMTLWAQAHPDQARRAFADRLAIFVGQNDEFGLLETSQRFHQALDALQISHHYQEIPGAGHTNYLERPEFMKELWSTLFRLAQQDP